MENILLLMMCAIRSWYARWRGADLATPQVLCFLLQEGWMLSHIARSLFLLFFVMVEKRSGDLTIQFPCDKIDRF